MINFLRYAFWGLIAVCLIIVGLANRGFVTVRALPEALAGLLGVSPDISMPLFVVIFLGVAAGLLIGFFWEWLREHKHRSAARKRGHRVTALEREIGRLKTEKQSGGDEVLGLLDGR